jgi:phosphate uptake regulator
MMSRDEIKGHAQRIGDEILQNAEFCMVYEDEELEYALESELRAIFDELVSLVSISPDELEEG